MSRLFVDSRSIRQSRNRPQGIIHRSQRRLHRDLRLGHQRGTGWIGRIIGAFVGQRDHGLRHLRTIRKDLLGAGKQQEENTALQGASTFS